METVATLSSTSYGNYKAYLWTISWQGKLYESSPEGCYIEPLEEKILPEFLQDLPLTHIGNGSLGHKGASVDCYSIQDDEGKDNVLLLRDNHVHWSDTGAIWIWSVVTEAC